MAGASEIEWTDATWNPVSGCLMVSPGCTNCYAMRMAARLQAMGVAQYSKSTRKSGGRAVWTGRVAVNETAIEAPLQWRKPRKIFVNSMSDLFQEAVDRTVVQRVWSVMERAPQHIFQILTKRPERMRHDMRDLRLPTLANVWLGTSVESGELKGRIQELQETPAAVRFISFEPLIAPIGKIDLTKIDWAIVGGESGPKARPIKAEWVEEIHAQCVRQGVAFFFKQWGGTNKKAAGRILNGRTWDEYPVHAAL